MGVEDEVYDYQEGTKEYEEVVAKTEKRFLLVEKLEDKILDGFFVQKL